MQVIIHVDGGSRGNPGLAAAASVISDGTGKILDEASIDLGEATNNVAEYQGLILGVRRARELGATDIEIINDSELIANQVNGRYKVKHPAMKELYIQALEELRGFKSWKLRTVPRAENEEADRLVNETLDGLRVTADT